MRTCYAGMEYFGPAPILRRMVEEGRITFVDETELTLAVGLQAAVLEVPWLPVARGVIGTDYERVREDLRIVEASLGTESAAQADPPLLALPAIRPDVCLVHVPYADAAGNALLMSSPSLDRQLISASGTVVVTADQVVEPDRLVQLGTPEVFAFEVDHVVELPGGASPTASYPHYSYDGLALLDHLEEVG